VCVCVYVHVCVCLYMSIDHFCFDTEQPFRSWNKMFSAVSTLQRTYYYTVLRVYVLQAVLWGSSHIHIFICRCYGFFDWGSAIWGSFSYYNEVLWDDDVYQMNLLTSSSFRVILCSKCWILSTIVRWCLTFQVMK